jgi:signal transduction histidine kinase
MLDLARLQTHIVDMAREDVDVADVVREVQERFAAAAAARTIALNNGVADGVVVRANRRQLFELLAVLVDNAVRYSPEGTAVDLTGERVDGRVVVAVRDHGIGIAPEHKARIFTEFFRANNAVRFDPNGNGLGLAIARELANYLEATLDVESRLGEGSVFHIRF